MPYRSVSLKRAKHLKGNLYLADNTFRLISLSVFKAYLGFLKLKKKRMSCIYLQVNFMALKSMTIETHLTML